MQGEADRQRDLLDVESLAGHLLPAGSVFAFLAEHRDALFPPELFADLFPSGRGRPSIPPEVIASVLVLQSLHGYSDREAVDALTFDLRWKAACGYPVDAKAFDASSLTVWRARLASSERPQRIFEVVRDVIAATGAVKGRQRRVLDSTILDDAVARQDTVTQLIAQVRRVGREVPGAHQVIAERCTRLAALTGQGYDSTAKPRIAWDDAQARDELVTALVNDALALLDGLDVETITAAGGKPAEAIALLALVAGQDVEPAEDSDGTDGRWRIARRVAPDRVISTVDPQARHAHKTVERRQDGFKAHVVIEPDTGLATMVELTKAAGPDNSDATVGARLVVADPTITGPVEVLGDSAYATGDMLATLSAAYDHPVDIEYTVNINDRGQPRINLVQCRPLQTRGLGEAVAMPTNPDPAGTLLRSTGNFMGGNVRLPLEYIVTVRPAAYLALSQQERDRRLAPPPPPPVAR